MKVGTTKDGYTVESILNRAYFHDCASDMLFDSDNPFTLFTSCFLCALTIELILKAWQLHINKQFVKIHNLKKLIEDIPALTLTNEMQVFLEDIDKLYDLRYPWDMDASKRNKDVPDKRPLYGEAYSYAKEMKNKLIDALVDQMPEDLNLIYEKIFFQSHGIYSPK